MSMGFGMLGLGLAGRSSVETPTASTLTNATDVALGPTSATIGVDTDTGNGTISWVTLLTADSTPSDEQIEAGTKADDSPAEDDGSQAVSGAGTQTITTKPTMLTPETGYKTAFVHKNGLGVFSNVIVADGFTTTAVVVGTANGGGSSTADPVVITASIAVAVGDLIVVGTSEQSATITSVGVTDNLGNTYAAPDADGQAASTTAYQGFYSIATNAGTLTAVNIDTTASTNDYAAQVVVFNGPYSALDAAPVAKTDNVRAWTGTATGTLAQASELVVGILAAINTSGVIVATSPWTLAAAAAAGGARQVAVEYRNVESTTTLTPSFNGDADSNVAVGTMSFRRAV